MENNYMWRFFLKSNKVIPIISTLFILPGFSEEMIRPCLFEVEIDQCALHSSDLQNSGYVGEKKPLCEKATKQANSADRLIELKKQLIEKEKQLIIKKRELAEKERQLNERENELLKREEERQDFLSAKADLQLYAQADEQDDQYSLQPPPPPSPEKKTSQPAAKVKQEQPRKCLSPFRTYHVGLRHTEARGIGYKHGYTTLEGFGIYDRNATLMPFFDLRGHVFDDGKFAGNVGIGARSYISWLDHVAGIYLYYDVRQRIHRLLPQQLSPGVELLGKRMEYRMNGYFPVGEDESRGYDFKFDGFEGHHIVVKGKQKRIMTGGDAEIGAHITQSTKYDIYGGGGPYYFTASDRSAWGGKVRLLARYKQYVSLEASYSYDHLFKSIVQGTIALNMPFGNKIRRKGKSCTDHVNLALGRAAFSPHRFEIPVVKKVTKEEKATNIATGKPWKVWFVDNTSSSSGTFESPFPTLAQAQNASSKNNMIYVFPGNGTTAGMDTGITLKKGQKFLGAGLSHKIKTEQGKILIPAFSSRTPTITNAGSIVTLASHNEVSGFNLIVTQTGSNAIDGTQGIQSTNINHNAILGSTVAYTGINVIGGGKLSVEKNFITGLQNINSFDLGIHIRNLDQTNIDIDVSKNFVSGFFRGIRVIPLTNPTTSMGTVNISKNFVESYQQFGIEYSTGMVNSTIKVTKNFVLNDIGGAVCRSIAIILNQQPNPGTVFVTKNNIVDTTTNAASTSILTEINEAEVNFARIFIKDNNMLVGPLPGSVGLLVTDLPGNIICESVERNIATLQTPGTTFGLQAIGGGEIIFDEFEDNVFPNMSIIGNVSFDESCQ